MRLFRTLVVLLLVAVAIAAFVLLVPYGPSTEVLVDIAPGTGTAGIAGQLASAGIIRSRDAFEAWKLLHPETLRAGTYRFDHPESLLDTYSRLHRGDVFTRTLVIPEGSNLFDIAGAVQAAQLGSADTFLAAARQHTELIRNWSPRATSLEGYLFPDTYRFSPHATPLTMLTAMTHRFTQQAHRLGLQPASVFTSGPNAGHTAADVVTVASLVEREVHVDAERPLVAGVFHNRLVAGMPLQTDPAVVYASLLAGTWTGVIHQSELHSASPYNTYTHTGLPPGPICDPGSAALSAALHPAVTPYLYFVAAPGGSTRFAVTVD